MNNGHFTIAGVRVSAVNPKLAVETIDRLIAQRAKTYVCVVPASTVVDCSENPRYREVINAAGMATPDGMPVVWFGRAKGAAVERTYGPDLMLNVCDFGQKKGYRHYLYGGTTEALSSLELRLKNQFPGIKIVGSMAPPFRELSQDEDAQIVEKINAGAPDILWVGLGSPKQDFWMQAHRDKLNVPVAIGVGAAFDFLSGTKPQAPRWLRGLGLEWLFRLCCEPKRLWRRYLIGNGKFLALVTQDLFNQKSDKL